MEVNFKEDYHKIKFKCQQCGRCCTDSKIRLSSYDILRLCKQLNISTVEFHQKYSYFILDKENQNLLTCMLKTVPECSFLGSDGCKVYSERPFGCRVFPLMVRHFFGPKGFSENKTYIVEKCLGFDRSKKITVGEFKAGQGVIDLLKIQEEWVKFKVKVINSKIINREKYNQLFYNLCYDCDGSYFQQALKQKGMVWPEEIEKKYRLIMELANDLLLPK